MIILDTNVISELMRPAPQDSVLRWIGAQSLDAIRITTPTCAEILQGIALLPEGRRRQNLSEQAAAMFTTEFAGRILDFDLSAARAYAELMAERQRRGHPLAAIDGMIAAIALVHRATLASRDRDVTGCGVPVVNPWAA